MISKLEMGWNELYSEFTLLIRGYTFKQINGSIHFP